MKSLLQSLEQKFQSIQSLRILALNNDETLLNFLIHNAKAREVFFTRISLESRDLGISTPPPFASKAKNLAILN